MADNLLQEWDDLIASLSPGELDEMLKVTLGVQARRETPEGYAAFYRLVFGHEPPKHVMADFIGTIFEAEQEGRHSLIWAARGFWKTTTVTVTWGAWQIGLHPEKANLIVAVNDDKATEFAEAIADIIDHHPNWGYAFPHVVPDKQKGWGAQGYEVKCEGPKGAYRSWVEDGNLFEEFGPQAYEDWRAKNTKRKDVTLRGRGYRSGDVVGAHPDGWLIIDDIHDEDNTDSPSLVAGVVKRVRDVILPTRVKDKEKGEKSKLVMIGTPWTEDDAYHAMKDTGRFVFRDVPVMRQVEPHAKEAVYIDHAKLKGWYRLTWPGRFDVEEVKEEYDLSEYRGFMRMYMLIIIAASDAGVRYVSYPADQIEAEKKVVTGGVDYGSVMEPTAREIRTRSHFAYLWCAHLPQGGVVIMDGVFEQLTRLQAEVHLVKVQNAYPLYRQTDFELDGKGEEGYVAIMQRHPGLRINGVRTGNKNKFKRFETEVQPDLESGAILISDAETPALDALRKSLENFPYGNMDILDACYYVRSSAADALAKVRAAARQERERSLGVAKPKKRSPWAVNRNLPRRT